MKRSKLGLALIMKFCWLILAFLTYNVASLNLSQLLKDQRHREPRSNRLQLVDRALDDLQDLEDILLDAKDDGRGNSDEYDNEIEDFDPLEGNQKNYRRRNYFLGHMARMNFRRRNHRSIGGVGNDPRQYRSLRKPNSYLDHLTRG